MQAIINNPFRVLALPVDAGQQLIYRRSADFRMYAAMGVQSPVNDDFRALLPSLEYSVQLVDEAQKRIHKDNDRLFHSLFWFEARQQGDEDVLAALKRGDLHAAVSQLNQACSAAIGPRNFSSYKNLALLCLSNTPHFSSNRKDSLLRGVNLFSQSLHFFASDSYYQYIPGTAGYLNAGEALMVRASGEVAAFLRSEIVEPGIASVPEILQAIPDKAAHQVMRQELTKGLSAIPIESFNKQIAEAEAALEAKKEDALAIGNRLLEQIRASYGTAALLIPEDEYMLLSDKLAQVLVRSSIRHFNETSSDADQDQMVADVRKLLESARSIGKSEAVAAEISKHLEELEQFAISGKYMKVLESIFDKLPKNMYKLNEVEMDDIPNQIMARIAETDELLARIRSEVVASDDLCLEISDAMIILAHNYLIKFAEHTHKYEEIVEVNNKLATYKFKPKTADVFNKVADQLNKVIEKKKENEGCLGSVLFLIGAAATVWNMLV